MFSTKRKERIIQCIKCGEYLTKHIEIKITDHIIKYDIKGNKSCSVPDCEINHKCKVQTRSELEEVFIKAEARLKALEKEMIDLKEKIKLKKEGRKNLEKLIKQLDEQLKEK